MQRNQRNQRFNRRPAGIMGAAKAIAAGSASYLAKKYVAKAAEKAAIQGVRKVMKKAPMKSVRMKRAVPLKKEVQAIKKEMKKDLSTLIYRSRIVRQRLTNQNEMAFTGCGDVGVSALETVLAQLRFFDPSNPGTFITGSGATGTYQRNWHFKSIVSKLKVRNNYQVPCKVTLYACTPKKDTSITAITAWSNGLADVGNPLNSSHLVYLTDSDEFADLWKVVSSKKAFLKPGDELSVSHISKDIYYDPSIVDSQTAEYQKQFGCVYYMVRLEGVLAHSAADGSLRGFAPAGVDATYKVTYTVSYDGGAAFKYIVLSDSYDAVGSTALVSQQPVADNQAYSVV